ncbi:MAG: 2-(1,2-epoxy-1,2-dihydrophenyl)acetyl-CoA isomerase [Alphaproteobacteria bacterium]|nr:2-(1,2-epoxy-1,2-dihydrophenyl)acetyl-CoA isomerase [Alphaproteobacteria bacterium]
MRHQTIHVADANGVRTLTLDRPERLNALSHTLVRELTEAVKAAGRDASVRCLLLTGAGRGFCAGADLGEGGMRENDPARQGERIARDMDRLHNPLVRALAQLEKPTLAAVNGPAAGGGMSLALACDIVIAARSAYFVQVFGPQLGLVPDMGSSWFLPRVAGRARALGLALTGERLSAEQAAQWGLIWRCVEDAQLLPEATSLAGKLAAGPTRGLGYLKRALEAGELNDLDAQLNLERDLQSVASRTADFTEGVNAFNEKRRPVFKGR